MMWQPSKGGKQTTSSLYGIGLLMVNLLLDGATNSVQDAMFRTFKVSGTSMMMYLNTFSFGFMLVFLALNPYSNEFSSAIAFCLSSSKLVFDIVLFGICGAVGQCFIFHTLEKYGSLVLVTTTVTRKMFSILLSVLMFGHPLNYGQWASVGLVFVAIIWESLGKTTESKKEHEKIDPIEKKIK
jgi:solute carrier family 35 (UDP-galactose transporter), member B1